MSAGAFRRVFGVLSVLCFLAVPYKALALFEDFNDALEPGVWSFQGSANHDVTNGLLEITDTGGSLAGAAWLNETIDCTKFRASFKVYIGDGGVGADGMVFGWVRAQAMGDTGGGLGWYGAAGPSGYGLVFDTWPNPATNMVSFENRDVHTGGDTGGYANFEPPIDLEHTGWFDVSVEMDNGHLQVWMSNEGSGFPASATPVIDYTDTGYQGFDAYFGFTGATGGSVNNHWADDLAINMGAVAPKDFRVYGGDTVTLTGGAPAGWTSATWQQVAGTPAVTLEATGDMVAEFDAPELDIGTILTFRLSVDAPSTDGITTDDVDVIITAVNAPKLAPSNLRVMPVDLGAGGLGCRVEWDPLVDAAEGYQIGLKFDSTIAWIEVIQRTTYESGGMLEGDTRTILIRGRNKYGTSDEPAAIAEVSYTAMPNVALSATGGGKTPPSEYLNPVLASPIGALNDQATDAQVHTGAPGDPGTTDMDGQGNKITDWYGYVWDEPHWFDRVVYYTGQFSTVGGWFTSLRVEITDDGTTWTEVPGAEIIPDYNFDNTHLGRIPFSRYDIFLPAVRARGIRIHGSPGGMYVYTSIAELEVFGDQTRAADALIVQGIDAEVPEGGTAVLDGSLSFSLAGDIVSWEWTGPAGITINNATSAVASFDAPVVDAHEVLVFSLTASDATNTDTDSDVRITVKNLPTTAVAGPNQYVLEGAEVTVDGSGSTSTTGNLTYQWTQTSGTEAGVTGAITRTVTFDAPILWDFTDELTFRLDVNDGGGAASDEVVVTVYNFAGLVYPLGPGLLNDLLHMGAAPEDRITAPVTSSPGTIDDDALETFGGEAWINPRPGEAYDFTGTGIDVTTNPMVWTQQIRSDGFFATEEFELYHQYYHIYIICPDDRDVMWRLYHDDDFRIWINGEFECGRRYDYWIVTNRYGLVADGRGLRKGVNSITIKFQEIGGGQRMGTWITDLAGNDFTDLSYSLGPAFILENAYGARKLPPTSYEVGVPVNVELSLRVNPAATPGSVNIIEQIPAGLSESDVSAPGATVGGGAIAWNLVGDDVKTTTLSYSVTPPAGMTQALAFSGAVSFGATSSDVFGDNAMYPVPTAPRYVDVAMVMDAVVTWSAPVTEGASSYTLYRSVNGGAWELLATTASTTYFDGSVVQGENYSYQVSATNVRGAEGPTSRPTPQATPLTQAEVEQGREIREAEDFNYGQGQYPGYEDCPAGNEAPTAESLDAQYDYFHPNEGGPDPAVYRTNDGVPDGLGVETVEEVDFPGVYHTNIGWIDAGSWWRQTFDVPEAGWINLAFRVAAPGSAVLAAYWDEVYIGRSVAFTTGSMHRFTYIVLEDGIETTAGEHVLRVEAVTSGWNFDKTAIIFNAAPPKRVTIWGDDFDSYTANSEVFDPAVGGWSKQTAGYPDGAWQLWNTAVEPDITGMKDGFMMSNSDMSGEDAPLDEQLISPQIDTSDYTKLRLNFNWNYQNYLVDPYDPQIAEVDMRVFDAATGWGDWINLLHLDLDSVPIDLDPAILSGTNVHDLSAYDGKTIQIRFHYYDAEWDYWFAMDTIRVSGIQPEIRAGIMGLSLVGDQLTLDWEPHGSYYIEHTTDLTGTWADLPGVPVTGTTAVVTIPAGAEGYYRLRAAE